MQCAYRSAGEIMNYFDFYSMQADSLHVCVPISVKMLVRQVGHVTIEMSIIFNDEATVWVLISVTAVLGLIHRGAS